jgi:TonB-linked SusC/RagA family outer membrane protein
MRNTLLFSIALGLTVTAEATTAKVANATNLHAATAYFNGRLVQNTVQGTVSDSNGPIEGVTVSVVGVPGSTITDAAGKFKINAPLGSTLRFSSIGYISQDVKVSSNSINVILQTEDTALEEVVIVGYGSQKRSNVTGAVTTVDVSKTFENRPVVDAGRALQGAVAGLNITTPSGDLGGDPTIRLRGVSGSLESSGGASPLILVDGVEVPSLNLISPNDIESMSVIKDASAAIYGSRAAYGVILIKTKSGKRGAKTTLSYNNNFGFQTPTTTPEIASGSAGAKLALDTYRRYSPGATGFSNLGIRYDDYAVEKMAEWEKLYGGQDLSSEMVYGRDYEVKDGFLYFHRTWDAADMFMKDWTPQQTHNLSVNGGSEKTNYNIGLGYMNQEGVLKVNPDEHSRYNLNVGVNTEISSWLTGYVKALYSTSEYSKPFVYNKAVYDPWFYLYRWPANYPYGTIDGIGMRNAINDVEQASMNSYKTNFGRFTLGGTAKIIDGLTIEGDYTYSNNTRRNHETGGKVYGWDFWNKTTFTEGFYSDANYDYTQFRNIYEDRHVANMFATWLKNYGNHNVKVMAGANAELVDTESQAVKRMNLLDYNYGQIGLANGTTTGESAAGHWSTLGFFGRVNYDYQDKYLVELLGRYDGSSRFRSDNRWGFFPAASVGYVVTKEDYMDWSKSFLSFLKVRGSWGSVGNQNVASSLFISTFSSAASDWLVGNEILTTLTTPSVISPFLTWETVTTKEVGVDAAFFNNKFNVTFNKYRRTVSDMISQGIALPSSFGAAAPKRNYGEMQTNGWELELAYNHQFNNGLSMRLSGQLSDFKETITKYAGVATVNSDGSSSNYEGKTIGEIWGYETDRFFTNDDFEVVNGKTVLKPGIPSQSYYESNTFTYGPGDVKFKDLNGDGVIGVGDGTVANPGDRRIIGNSSPRYSYGFRADFGYKGFDLGLFFQGVAKRDIWAGGDLAIPGWRYADAYYVHQLDYWTPENPNAYYPAPAYQAESNTKYNFLPQSKYLLDMSYFRLKNVTLGYNIPQTVLDRAKIQKLRVFFSGENLFELDNLNVPIDPETDYTADGANDKNSFGRSYPYRRTLSFGLQLTF